MSAYAYQEGASLVQALLRAQAPAGPPAWGGFGNRVSQLPQTEQRRFMAAMRPYRPDIRAARLALGEARTRLAAAIARPEYDTTAAITAFADVRAHAATMQERMQEATSASLATLSRNPVGRWRTRCTRRIELLGVTTRTVRSCTT